MVDQEDWFCLGQQEVHQTESKIVIRGNLKLFETDGQKIFHLENK